MKIIKTAQFKVSQQIDTRPGGTLVDRSLEGFLSIGQQLRQQLAGVHDQNAKQELGRVISQFSQQIVPILQKYQKQGIGYKPTAPVAQPIVQQNTKQRGQQAAQQAVNQLSQQSPAPTVNPYKGIPGPMGR